MKLEREIKISAKFDTDEITILELARTILESLEREMVHNHCGILSCNNDSVLYDISDLRGVIGDLEMFKNVSKITN